MRSQMTKTASSESRGTRASEKQLEKNREHPYRVQILNVETNTTLLAYITRDHRLECWNASFAATFGLRQNKADGVEIASLLDRATYESLRPLLDNAFLGHVTSFQFVAPAIGASSRGGYFSATLTPEHSVQMGPPQILVCQVQDITDHRIEETRAKEQRSKISHILNHIPQLVWTTNAHGELIYTNGRFISSTGTKQQRPRNWIHSVHPQDAHAVIGKWNASVTSGDIFEGEYRLQDDDGKSTWVFGRAEPIRDGNGNITEWFGTAMDIHDKKESEFRRSSIQRKVSQLQTVAASLSVAHTPLEVAQIVVDQGLDAIDAVAGCVVVTEPTGGKLDVIYSRGYSPSTLEFLEDLTLQKQLPLTEAIINRKPVFLRSADEIDRYAEVKAFGLHDRKSFAAFPLMVHGEAIGALSFSYGVPDAMTEERVGYLSILAEQCAQAIERARLFEAERLARRSAEIALRAKSQFLANMSHEIRTPMNAILGFADLLGDRTLNETEREEYRRRIRMNGDQLMHLIDDVLDLTKMEAGKINVQNVPFVVGDLVRDVLAAAAPSAKRKGITTRLVTDASVPRVIETDPVRLRQILSNLMDNSIKFTDHGRIETRVGLSDSNLVVEIEDTGIGISPELHERLFQAFTQGDSSVTRRFGGSGLGLVVSRGIAEAMGGTLEHVRSESSQGSVFRLSIPLVLKAMDPQIDMFSDFPEPRSPVKPGLELEGVNVLLVEDSFDNEMLIRAYLKGTGVELEVAHNGVEAVNRASIRDFDIVFMDIQMPVMDGLEATRRLRGRNYTGPIVALSAHALPEEVERSIEAGCLSHLTKPIMRDVLIAQIRNLKSAKR